MFGLLFFQTFLGLIVRKFLSLALTLTVMTASMTAPVAVGATELKIGVVNMERILSDSRSAAEASERLNAESQRRQAEIDAVTKRFKHRLEGFEKNAVTMTEREVIAERRELAEMERDLARRNREARDEMNQRRNEEVLLLQNRASRVVRDIAEKEKFDLVLYECFYASKRVDITDRVMKEVDQYVAAK